MEKKFVTFYPGIYTEREKPALREFLDTCQAIIRRGPVSPADIAAGKVTEDMPGVYTQLYTEEIIRYNNAKYDPDNPIYNDEEYVIGGFKIGELTQKLYDTLTGIQWGKIEDTKGWIVPVC